jgi:NAD(P)-dependent dehydrogenase (short-subunit alcohol dehydrogenase family)
MPNILIIGATRGLGAALATAYAARADTTVFATTRSTTAPKHLSEKIIWLPHIDVGHSGVGAKLVKELSVVEGEEGGRKSFDAVVCICVCLCVCLVQGGVLICFVPLCA